MILNETHYAQLRQSVKDKLGVNTTTYIADLKL
jgi:hypothetical protein